MRARVARDEVDSEACANTVAASRAGDPGSRLPGQSIAADGVAMAGGSAKTQPGPPSFGFKLWHEWARSSGARRCRGRDDGGMACEAVFVCGKGGREMCMPVESGLYSHSWSTWRGDWQHSDVWLSNFHVLCGMWL